MHYGADWCSVEHLCERIFIGPLMYLMYCGLIFGFKKPKLENNKKNYQNQMINDGQISEY
jgi:hypothetical protein